METKKKVLIATGGTGGHLYPGIALARELKSRNIEVVFVLKKNDIGRDLIAKEDFEYFEIPVVGMPRRIALAFITFLILLTKSYFLSKKLLKQQRPDCVVGMGGYISFPVVMAASALKIKTFIHEQNFVPGLANRILARFVSTVAVSFEESAKLFKRGRVIFTGNPVRKELFFTYGDQAYSKFMLSRDRFTVLIFGGSQGAKKLNDVMVDCLMFLTDVRERIQFLHIAGKTDAVVLRSKYKQMGYDFCVLDYLDTIGDAYQIADIIICRSGATTVAELKILSKPAILVPFPYATANHQEFNASTLVASRQAVMMREKELRPDLLAEAIKFRMKSFGNTPKPRPSIPEKFPQEILADLILAE